MKRLEPNPFRFGNPVEGDYYLPRPELSSTIRKFIENHIHIVLTGPRRFGKTSFVLNLLGTLEKEGYTCFLVDIFNITSHRDFLQQLMRAIESKKSLTSKVKAWLSTIRLTVPKITAEIDSMTGNPSLGATVSRLAEKDTQTAIQDILEGLSSLGHKVVIAEDYDPFAFVRPIENASGHFIGIAS